MAQSPLKYKVYDRNNSLIGATRFAEDCAVLLACNGGAVVRVNGRIVYREDAERGIAADSYDLCAQHIHYGEQQQQIKAYNKRYGEGAAEARLGPALLPKPEPFRPVYSAPRNA